MRAAIVLAVAAVLVAGCGSQSEPESTRPSSRNRSPGRSPQPRRTLSAVQVTVVDGDTNRRVKGVRVQIGRHAARSDRRGIAHIPLGRRAALVTIASKIGYGERAVRLSFRSHPKSTIRVYRPSRQWTMYGAGPTRTQAQPCDRGAAAVPGRLVARARHADRVSRGRRRRSRLHRQRPWDRACARHARRQRDLAPRHTAREDGRVSGRRRRRPSSSTGWTATCGSCAAPTGSCSGATRSAPPSSPRRS